MSTAYIAGVCDYNSWCDDVLKAVLVESEHVDQILHVVCCSVDRPVNPYVFGSSDFADWNSGWFSKQNPGKCY